MGGGRVTEGKKGSKEFLIVDAGLLTSSFIIDMLNKRLH